MKKPSGVKLDYRIGDYVLDSEIDFAVLNQLALQSQAEWRAQDHYQYQVRKGKLFHEVGGDTMRFQDTCPCGKHRGIVFFKGTHQLSQEPLCPTSVWLAWYRQAVENGTWREFLEKRPMGAFVEQFVL